MLRVLCYMNIGDYIEKLRARPEGQKEKIAIAATAVSFLIVLTIWLISFSEANKASSEEQNSPAPDQLEDLRNSFGQDKQSIEEMIENLPEEEAVGENSRNMEENGLNNQNIDPGENKEVQNGDEQKSNGSQSIPSLP